MKLFVDYRSTDQKKVDELVADLKALGHEVWYDRELEGGQKWWENILVEIQKCDALIFAMTPAALESRACRAEYTYANALNKQLVPVLMDKSIQISLLPVILQERHIVDYTNPGKEAYKALLNTLNNLPSTPPLPHPLPEPPPIPISPLVPLKNQIDQPSLPLEQQITLAHQLKGFLSQPEYHTTARQLLERLRDHPSLLANVLRDIEESLAAPPPRQPKVEIPEFPTAQFVAPQPQAKPKPPQPAPASPPQSEVKPKPPQPAPTPPYQSAPRQQPPYQPGYPPPPNMPPRKKQFDQQALLIIAGVAALFVLCTCCALLSMGSQY